MLNILKKDFLVGIGTGFIISGIMIAYFGIGQPTDDEIRARAAELGMSQQSGAEKEQVGNSSPGKETPDTNFNEKQSLSADTPVSADTAVSPKNPVSESVKKPATVVIEIKSGMGSETVARVLEEKGVVKDKDEFYKVVTAKRAHSKFKVGKFAVPLGGDMEEIVAILTGK